MDLVPALIFRHLSLGQRLSRLKQSGLMPLKRSIVFDPSSCCLVALGAGLGYFQFIVKPQIIKQFIARGGAAAGDGRGRRAIEETWTPRLPAIGSFRAVQGIDVAPQVGGALVAVKVESGQDVAKGTPLFEIDNFVEQADLKNNLAVLKNADLALQRQRELTTTGNTTKANFDWRRPRAIRPRPRSKRCAPSSRKSRSPRPSPAASASASSTSASMSRREPASSHCSSWIRSTSIFPCPRNRSTC